MALKINTQTNLNDMFDKFASLPGDKLAKEAKEKTEKEAKK